MLAEPINIYSGEAGLGAALTNPTELGRHKGKLPKALRVTFDGKLYPDAEAAYQANKTESLVDNDRMMVEVLCAKFRQHPELAKEVELRGGGPWLASCSHITGARSESAQRWEGAGLESRFIRNLVAGWEAFVAGDTAEAGQSALF
jgi:hypothetical protein